MYLFLKYYAVTLKKIIQQNHLLYTFIFTFSINTIYTVQLYCINMMYSVMDILVERDLQFSKEIQSLGLILVSLIFPICRI